MLFTVVAVSFLVLYKSTNPFQFLPNPYSSNKTGDTKWDSRPGSLENILEKAAMGDKTVIITTLNEAWCASNSVFDLFLKSFKTGIETRKLLDHLVVVAMDQNAYARCSSLHPHCYALSTNFSSSGEAYFMTPVYLQMMWKRIDFLRSVLELGYNFIFTDADIMWFRDPFKRFHHDADFQIACDNYWGNPKDIKNMPNGGFNYVKSNNRTIQFYKFWYSSRETYPKLHDQDVLNMIKSNPFIKNIGLEMRFLDTKYFGGFCEPSKDLNLVCTMHANCCFGLDNKVKDLRILLQDWSKYMELNSSEKLGKKGSWSVPKSCLHRR